MTGADRTIRWVKRRARGRGGRALTGRPVHAPLVGHPHDVAGDEIRAMQAVAPTPCWRVRMPDRRGTQNVDALGIVEHG